MLRSIRPRTCHRTGHRTSFRFHILSLRHAIVSIRSRRHAIVLKSIFQELAGVDVKRVELKSVFAALLLSFGLAAAAEAQTPPSSEATVKILDEDYDPIWNVSGNVIVGIMASAEKAPLPYLSLKTSELSFQPDVPRTFCIDITSRCRSFRAKVEIGVTPNTLQPYSVSLSDKVQRPEFVDSLQGEQIAVKAQSADCAQANQKNVAYLVSTWGEKTGTEPPKSLLLLLNARMSEVAVSLRGPDGQVFDRKQCARVKDPQQTGYDFTCEMSLATLPESVDMLHGTIARRSYGGPRKISRFSILLKD